MIGALVGMTGMGGGSLMTPLLVILFHVNPTKAIGTDIAHGAIFKTISAIQHRRMGNVSAQLSGWMFLGSAPMSLLGVWLASWLSDRYGDDILSTSAYVLGGALLFGCLGLITKNLLPAKGAEHPDDFDLTSRDRIAAVLIGMFGGFVVGLTSVGSGVFFGLSLLVLFPLKAHKVVGTDIFHAAALLYVAGFGHVVAGNVNMHMVGWLLLGSIPGCLLGGRLTLHVPEKRLRATLACVLGVSGLKLINIPYANEIVVGVLGVFVVGLTLLVWKSWREKTLRERAALETAPS